MDAAAWLVSPAYTEDGPTKPMVSLPNLPTHYARRCYDLNAMETPSLKISGMPAEYYRAQAARVRGLAQDATTDAVREHLAAIALQYEMLADGAAAATRDPQ